MRRKQLRSTCMCAVLATPEGKFNLKRIRKKSKTDQKCRKAKLPKSEICQRWNCNSSAKYGGTSKLVEYS